ncbi:MAG TPA: hypothetical protein VFJ30_03470 [Phycisphaerae bacterium]|nr:hypothetical protein [Phycisphaerae bacterium]
MTKRLALVAAAVACWSTVAGATSLGLPQGLPDIYSQFIYVDYVYDGGSSSGTLTATGTARQVDLPPTSDIWGGLSSFALSVRVSDTGAVLGGADEDLKIEGHLDLNGDMVVDPGEPVGTLLTGRVTQFGFPEGTPQQIQANPLEFVFAVTGGQMADLYGGIGSVGAVTLWQSGFGGSLTSSFNNALIPGYAFGIGVSDTYAVVPEPITALVAVPIGLLFRLAQRRFRAPHA